MKKYILGLAAAAAIAIPAFQAANAQIDIVRKPSHWRGTLLEGTDALIATDKAGYPVFIQSGETVGSIFAPAAITGEQLAAEFNKLCLQTNFDPARLGSAAGSSTLGLSSRSLQIAPLKKGTGYHAEVWVSPAARVQIWAGDATGLNKRQTLSRWRNGATMSYFRPSDIAVPSCGLTMMSTGLHNPQSFLTAMKTLVGLEPAKVVTKESWADGFWSMSAPDGAQTKIFYSMTDLNREEQLLHVAVIRLPRK